MLSLYQHIEAETKWSSFCKRHFNFRLVWKSHVLWYKFHWNEFLRIGSDNGLAHNPSDIFYVYIYQLLQWLFVWTALVWKPEQFIPGLQPQVHIITRKPACMCDKSMMTQISAVCYGIDHAHNWDRDVMFANPKDLVWRFAYMRPCPNPPINALTSSSAIQHSNMLKIWKWRCHTETSVQWTLCSWTLNSPLYQYTPC